MSTENLEQEDQNRTTEPIIDIPGNEAPADPEQEIVSQGVHNYSAAETYVCPTDPAVLQQLEWFRDQKLALMMHFGLYCQPGMVASWALSDKDSDWSRHQVNWTDGETFKKQYFSLNRSFNPVRFQPEEWAQMAEDCGFRYLLLTTKHHDGFCLWDTKYTDYKTTAEDCPFHEHKNADIVKSMFDAFRAKGIGIGAYFSKADWHCPDYWKEDLRKDGLTSRGPSYDPKEYPEVWNRFKEYTKNQVLELCENYGKLDILWFDAGWVSESNGQDIELGKIVEEARKIQPWILSVDRTIGGAYENYVTPELCIPEEPLNVPWESCLTLGVDFTYEYGDHYKSPRELVGMLVNIVAKGGAERQPTAGRPHPGRCLGQPERFWPVDENLRRCHLRNPRLRAVPERNPFVHTERRFRLCVPTVSDGTGIGRGGNFRTVYRGENFRDLYGGKW